jgi:hypothetical protein
MGLAPASDVDPEHVLDREVFHDELAGSEDVVVAHGGDGELTVVTRDRALSWTDLDPDEFDRALADGDVVVGEALGGPAGSETGVGQRSLGNEPGEPVREVTDDEVHLRGERADRD